MFAPPSPTGAERCLDAEPRARKHGRDERMADFLVHVIGAAAALAGAAALLVLAHSRDQGALAPIAVYATGLVLTFAASAAYNLGYDTRLRALLRRFDHSAIFLMIAGTYTPFTTRLANGPAAIWMTAGVWSVALGGIALKLTSPELFERVGVGVYLALGWAARLHFSLDFVVSERALRRSVACGGRALYGRRRFPSDAAAAIS